MLAKRFVRVVWWDATDQESSWVSDKDATAFGETTLEVVSFGYEVHNTEKYITLAADCMAELDTWGRVTKIPKGMIQSVEEWKGPP